MGQGGLCGSLSKRRRRHVLVISSEQSGKILLEYGERWKIETLFGILKTRGFRLEDTHLTEVERISNLLSLLTIAVSWAILAGELEVQETPLKTKKHGHLEKSIFRLAFESLRNCFCQLTTNFRQKQRFQQLTLLLSCTLVPNYNLLATLISEQVNRRKAELNRIINESVTTEQKLLLDHLLTKCEPRDFRFRSIFRLTRNIKSIC